MENATSSKNIIEFKDIKKSFGSQHVLKGLTFGIPRGSISFIIGQSGEGKSVTLKHIAGLLNPDSGTIVFDGKEMTKANPKEWIVERQKIGFLFQDGALFDSLSVFENVVFALREHKKLREEELLAKAKELLSLVGLAEKLNNMPAELSIGEKKRVGLARALSLNPLLLMYDEPTTSMDPLICELIDQLIQKTQEQNPGMTSIVVSHDVRSILDLAEYIVFLVKGVLYYEGGAKEFKESKDPMINQFLKGECDGPLTS